MDGKRGVTLGGPVKTKPREQVVVRCDAPNIGKFNQGTSRHYLLVLNNLGIIVNYLQPKLS